MEEIDYDVGVFNESAKRADANLAVRFYTQAIQNDVKSTQEGRPIFDDVDMIEIRVRGDRNNVVQRPARDDDRKRFRDAYAAFKESREQTGSGTPLSQWPIMSTSLVEELRYFGFYTVEQVAEADEMALGRMAGLRAYKDKAKLFLEHAKGGAPIETLSKENEDLKNRLQASEAMIGKLSAQLEKLTAKLLADQPETPAVAPEPRPAAARR